MTLSLSDIIKDLCTLKGYEKYQTSQMVLKCQQCKSVAAHVAISSWHQQNIHPLKIVWVLSNVVLCHMHNCHIGKLEVIGYTVPIVAPSHGNPHAYMHVHYMYPMWLDHPWISIPHAFTSPKYHAMSLLPIPKSHL